MHSLSRQSIVVLLIDDQAIIGESVRGLLQSEAHVAFHHVQEASEALERAAALAPTVILLDLVMPGVDGLVLLRQLRRHEATRDVPVVVLSTKEQPAIKAEAFRLGANDYLIKLPSAVELVARVRYHSEAYRNAAMRRLAMQALAESREQLRISNEEIARQAAGLEARNRFIKKTFGRYLSDEVVSQLLDSPEGLRLGGESRVVTILMADLRGFTSTCDGLAAVDVMRMLNAYLGAMARVITEHQGMVDEFIGDAILAIFGAPLSRDNDAWRAARCALAMQREMQHINAALAKDGLPRLEMGVALHTGEVVVGNIGSDVRAKYGVVGSNVNLTSRIESMTTGGQILMSDATRQAVGEVAQVGQRLHFRPKGFVRDTVAWDLLGLAGEDNADPVDNADKAEPRDAWATLKPPLALRFWCIEDKAEAPSAHLGQLLGVSAVQGLLHTALALAPFTELRLALLPLAEGEGEGEVAQSVWAKVRETTPDGTRLHFSRPLSHSVLTALTQSHRIKTNTASGLE